jgi:hypothetical protein
MLVILTVHASYAIVQRSDWGLSTSALGDDALFTLDLDAFHRMLAHGELTNLQWYFRPRIPVRIVHLEFGWICMLIFRCAGVCQYYGFRSQSEFIVLHCLDFLSFSLLLLLRLVNKLIVNLVWVHSLFTTGHDTEDGDRLLEVMWTEGCSVPLEFLLSQHLPELTV